MSLQQHSLVYDSRDTSTIVNADKLDMKYLQKYKSHN